MRFPVIISILLLFQVSLAELDINGNGISEIWELKYPWASPTEVDDDQDGVSNFEEAVAGTDPSDASSFLKLDLVISGEQEVSALWKSIGGKSYRIEKLVDNDWEEIASFLPRAFSSEREVSLAHDPKMMLRIVASDIDLDGDGLTAWEEAQFGWSDASNLSSGDLNRLDYPSIVRKLEAPNGLNLSSGESLTQLLPSPAAASRFLMQSSFGPTMETIQGVSQQGYSNWLDEQLALSPTLSATTMWSNGASYSALLWKNGWWKLAVDSPDQLRQRMAYALSQIFVTGYQAGNWLGDNPLAQASYYDFLVKGSFDNYRNLLEDVTYSPAMGMYLSSLKNRKGDAEAGRYPDENFAREIMQLFSIGLWELNADGSRRLDENGYDIPTYDNSDITEMAKVFTGLSYGKNGINNDPLTFYSGVRGNAFLHPMKVYDEEHEPGPKQLLSGVILNDVENGGESLNGEQEVQATLDMLSEHANTAPFISRLLIQRLTSSNPGADYLRRVVASWRIEGSPERRLGRVIEAILLDPDVRNGNSANQGKVREPVIRLTHLIRALELGNDSDRYYFSSDALDADLGQHPMLSPTVFNFYPPSYSPQGELADQNLVSPELEISSVVQMIESDNLYRTFVDSGHSGVGTDYSTLLALEDSTSDLLDHLELLFSSRELSEETRATMTATIDSQTTPLQRVKTAAHLIITCPEVTVLK